jgi:Kelch motif/Galactose oxidase, central domain
MNSAGTFNRRLGGFAPRHLSLLRTALLCYLFLSVGSWITAQSSWRHKGPHARSHHSAVYDPDSGRMIIYAGQHAKNFPNESDVWWGVNMVGSTELHWIPALPGGGHPGARFGHTAVFDAINNRMIVFGGGKGTNAPAPCQNDVWLLKTANGVTGTPVWSQQTPSGTAPAPRFAHTAVYDPNTNSMIVFGGYDCTGNYFSDVWILSNANGLNGTPAWLQLSPGGFAPSGRENATAVYDSANNLMIVCGGDSGTPVDGDVWVLSYANGTGGTPTWTQLLPTGAAPVARSGHSAIYDAVNNRMTIYGGEVSIATSGLLNDSWVLTNANGLGGTPGWTQVWPATVAALRSFHTAVYDSADNLMLIFGGNTNVAKLPTDDHITIFTQANGMAGADSHARDRKPPL